MSAIQSFLVQGGASAGGNSVIARSASVSGTATGVVYTVAHLLGSTSVFSLLSGSNANLAINSTTGAITATAAIGTGSSQLAIIREAISAENRAEEYPLTLTGAVVVPAAPTLSLAAGNGQISVAWTDGSNGGASITDHKLYRGTTSGGEVYIGSIGTSSPYVDTGLTNGTTYYYKLSAVNSVGEGALSTEQSTTPQLAVFTQPYNRLIMNPVGDSRPAQSGGDSGTIGTTDFNRAVNATGPMAFLPMLSGNRLRWNGGPNLGVGGEAVEGSLGVPRPLGTGNNPVFNGSISGTTLTISAFTAGTNILAAGQRIGGAGTGINRDTFLVSGAGNTWTVTPSQTVASFTGAQAGNPAIDIVAFAARVEANIPFMMGTNSSDAAISPGGAAQVIYQQAIRALTDPTYVYPPYGAVLPLYGGLPKNLWLIDEEPQGIDSTGAVANARTLSRVGFIQGWSDFVRKFAYNSGDALANPHVYVAPLWDDSLFLDAATGANHRNIAGLLADGLHNGGAGAYEQSRLMSVGVNALLDTSVNFAHLADTTQQNTLACLITNGCFTGTTGGTAGLSGTLVGSIPTGWNFGFGGDAGLTYTTTQTALGGALGYIFKVRITGTIASTTSINFQSSFGSIISSVNCATDTFRMCSMLKLTMTSGGLFNLGPTVYMNVPGTGHYFVLGDSATGSPTYSGGNFTYWKQQAADASHDWLTLASANMDWPGRGFTGAPSGGNTGWDIGIAPGTVDITIEWRQHTVALVTD